MKWCWISICLVWECCVWLFANAMHHWLSHMMDVKFSCTYPTSAKNCLSQIVSLVQWLIAMYSASVVENAMVGCSLHFYAKLISYKFCLRDAIKMASPLQDLTMYLFRLNWTFKPFDTNLFTENKLACNLDMWNTSLVRLWLILSSKIASTTMNPILIA